MAAGQNSTLLDYASTTALGLDAPLTICDAATNAAASTLPATGSDGLAGANIVIDTQAPVVTTSGTTLAFTESGSATAIDSGLTVNDNVANLVGATVAISSGYASGQDLLGFTNQNGITGSFNATTGVLRLPAPHRRQRIRPPSVRSPIKTPA